jgi:altronate dehydratase large subunit
MEFLGYKRENGKFGVRSHVLVLSSVSCANGVVDAIARALPDVVPVTHAYGCGTGPEDIGVSIRTLNGLMNNPNVGAVLIIGLGCENVSSSMLTMGVQDKPVEALVIQECGGSAATTARGIEIAARFLKELAAQERVPAPVSELIVGLKSGGSDVFSGITANPAVGAAADRLVHEGATVILTEMTEMAGTAHILKSRCCTPEIGEQVENLINEHRRNVRASLGELAGMSISLGNIDGGLSSITEKSLGCIMKSGTTPITELIEHAGRPSRRGLIIMAGPGYDIDSMAAEAAAGSQIILFTTGRGTPAGFPAVPVIKITSNSLTYNKMPGDADINAGSIVDSGKTVDEVGQEIFDFSIEVANGRKTCAEINRSIPFNYLKQGPTY